MYNLKAKAYKDGEPIPKGWTLYDAILEMDVDGTHIERDMQVVSETEKAGEKLVKLIGENEIGSNIKAHLRGRIRQN